MYFKKIYMHGFKSFAEPVTIEFHPGITCVVGPNGSGKSNLSDAIRWVLGEQSAKSLRGGKMEDVIFNGTVNRKSRGMAEVTLTIDNSTGILPIEYNEVAITRRMYRSGESEYSINGNQCRLRDIRELIMDTGIGVDGYSLIGQGKIAEIIDSKTEGRRQIFEEAAGIVMYRTRKQEAERKLKNAGDNLDRVNDIIGEIEGRIDGLREESIKATEFVALRDRFKELEINITLKNVDAIDAKLIELKNDIAQIEDEQEQIRRQKEESSREHGEIKSRNEALDSLAEETRNRLIELIDEIHKLQNQEQIDEQKLKSMEEEEKRLTGEKDELQSRFDTEKSNRDEILETLSAGEAELKTLNDDLEKKVADFSSKAEKLTRLLEEAENAKASMYELSSKAASKRTEAKSYDGIKATFVRRRNQIEEERKLTGEDDLQRNYEKAEADRDEAASEVERLRNEGLKISASYNGKTEKLQNIRKNIEDAKLDIGRISARKKTIEEMKSNYEGYNYAVKFIMKQGLAGIYGTAADLMKVPHGYETAIETALGAQMQNIICEDDECAKKAVNILKSSSAGRLTFIPLKSIKYNPADVKKAAGFKGMASDIIECDDKFLPAYKYLLGRVAITENMDNAISMSKSSVSGVRFVTLDGEIIGSTGAITGGKYRNKTANLLERKNEVEELSVKLSKAEDRLAAENTAFEELSGEMAALQEELKKLDSEYKEAEIELNNRNNDVENAKRALSSMEERTAQWDKELEEIRENLANADDTVNGLLFEALEAEKEAREARAKSAELTEEYNRKKSSSDKSGEAITNARIKYNQADTKLSGTRELAAKSEELLAGLSRDIESKKSRLDEIEAERAEIFKVQEEGTDSSAKLENKKELEDKLAQITEEKTSIKEKIEEYEKQQSEYDEKSQALSDRKISANIQITRSETQLDNLKDKLWESFEISYIQALEFKKEDFVLSRAVKENREIKARMNELGDVNIGSIEEYAQVSERYEFLTTQRNDILEGMTSLSSIINDMDRTIKIRFKENFNQVAGYFEEVFKELFGGGYAELVLSNEDNPLESEIEIIAQPPEKKLQNINLLSGGEKTMTAIALMFAVLKAKPTPFCILDEVEAALDEDNMIRFANYLKNFNEIQFALITHQKTTMEHADVLYGVTMPERGISKVLSLKLGDTVPGLE